MDRMGSGLYCVICIDTLSDIPGGKVIKCRSIVCAVAFKVVPCATTVSIHLKQC